ncbi:hypothetical protein [Xanthomonas sp. XNM01]|uniref:XAC0095 family protein n=1 Tax=Xanthomonas sp. XNM01 TaxID=2769289 RepID=UPI001785B483|nr:hypothetical protein [Xanthomonas sp. XNM01]MBD9369239.1 hypothetical protein [Xanthomonas sp. XNM01]
MSTYASNGLDGLHYVLPEDSQLRLQRVRDHVRFLAQLAEPRSADEGPDSAPEIRMGELTSCLELLGDHLDRVLQEVSWPSRPAAAADAADTSDEDATDVTDNASPDAPDTDTAHLTFGVTLDQIDTLNRLIETITAHGDVVAATDMAEFADGTLSVVGHAIFDAAGEVREVLDEVNAQRLGPATGLPSRVREARAGYGPAGASLH